MEALVAELSRRALVDGRALERARGVAAETGRRLDTVMVQLGIVGERAMAEALATVSGLTLATAADYPALPVLADRLRPGFLRHARALPLRCDDDALVLAVADPLDPFTPAAIAAAAGRTVICMVAVPVELEAALATLFPAEEASAGDDPSPEPIAAEEAERLRDMASEAPVIRIVNQIITRAVEAHASDIHIEPFEDRLRVRYRFDGMLHEAEMPPARLSAAIVSRIKIMARLDIAERRLPQDGRIRLAIRGHDVDFRVATVPSLWGETVVLRVLDRSAVAFDYARLGLAAPVVARLTAALEQPNGVLLVTGPTGSGKTTTLYAALTEINHGRDKIVTIEDPVEYQLPGVLQIPVNERKGLTFARGLRSILRHDPDKILVGEIRDPETAQIAVQSALTGHLVFTSVHANSTFDVISRFKHMGVDPYSFVAALNGIVAQRLVRMNCPDCCHADSPSAELLAESGIAQDESAQFSFMASSGCGTCRGTGFRGRRAIAEFLVMDDELRELVVANAPIRQIKDAARRRGTRMLREAALELVRKGQTTLQEINRVTFVA